MFTWRKRPTIVSMLRAISFTNVAASYVSVQGKSFPLLLRENEFSFAQSMETLAQFPSAAVMLFACSYEQVTTQFHC